MSGVVGYQDENDIALRIPYVFGSSRPRDLSYLDFLPAKLRVYNARLSTRAAKGEPSLGDYLRQIRAELSKNSQIDQRRRDRSVDSAIKQFVFGSSTPRELSYLERLPWEFRIYDVKLGPNSKRHDKRSKTTSFSSTGSGNGRQGARTSSLNFLDSSNSKIDHSRRLVQSAQENIAVTKVNKPTQRSPPANRSKSSTRSTSNASQTSSQKAAPSKHKPRQQIQTPHVSKAQTKTPVTEPIEIHCPTSPLSSAVPSHELATFDASSPTSDEFYIIPSIALTSDTNVGLNEFEAPNQKVESQEIKAPRPLVEEIDQKAAESINSTSNEVDESFGRNNLEDQHQLDQTFGAQHHLDTNHDHGHIHTPDAHHQSVSPPPILIVEDLPSSEGQEWESVTPDGEQTNHDPIDRDVSPDHKIEVEEHDEWNHNHKNHVQEFQNGYQNRSDPEFETNGFAHSLVHDHAIGLDEFDEQKHHSPQSPLSVESRP